MTIGRHQLIRIGNLQHINIEVLLEHRQLINIEVRLHMTIGHLQHIRCHLHINTGRRLHMTTGRHRFIRTLQHISIGRRLHMTIGRRQHIRTDNQ
jgi:hypothetical protein